VRPGLLLACAAALVSVAAGGGASRQGGFDVFMVAFGDATHGLISVQYAPRPCPTHVCPFSVLATRDGGRSWALTIRSSVSLDFRATVAVSPGSSVAWAYFPCFEPSCRPGLYESSNWGRTWRLVGRPRLLTLRFATTREGWGMDGRYALVATHDGGRRWRPIPKQPCAGSPFGLAAVAFAPVSARRGWVLCSDLKTVAESVALYETRDGGRSWKLRAQRAGTQADWVGRGVVNLFALRELSFRASGRGWIWRYAGRPLRSADGGRSWRPAAGWPLALNTYSVNSGSAVSDTLAYAAVGTLRGPTLLLRTANAGRTWAVVHRWPRP
jgi:photosystem II stability/assembly factor-like uncharacterized protein